MVIVQLDTWNLAWSLRRHDGLPDLGKTLTLNLFAMLTAMLQFEGVAYRLDSKSYD